MPKKQTKVESVTFFTEGRDTTDTSRIWNPGDPVAKNFLGEETEAPTGADEKPRKSTKKTAKSETNPEALPEEKGVDTGMEPQEAETPSPPEELQENTNTETEALEDAADVAPADAPNGPQDANLDNVDESTLPPIERTDVTTEAPSVPPTTLPDNN